MKKKVFRIKYIKLELIKIKEKKLNENHIQKLPSWNRLH